MWFKRNKIITLYAVFKKDDPKKFLTLTVKKEDSVEFVLQLLKLIHYNHYSLWCDIRKYNPDDTTCFMEYVDCCIDSEEKNEYLISKVKYKIEDVAAMLRMFSNYVPLGCSYETNIEKAYYAALDKINKKIIEEEESSNGE